MYQVRVWSQEYTAAADNDVKRSRKEEYTAAADNGV
jgi:hypothetical protein